MVTKYEGGFYISEKSSYVPDNCTDEGFEQVREQSRSSWGKYLRRQMWHDLRVVVGYLLFVIIVIVSEKVFSWMMGDTIFGDTGVLLMVTILFPLVPELIFVLIRAVSDSLAGYNGMISGFRESVAIAKDLKIINAMRD